MRLATHAKHLVRTAASRAGYNISKAQDKFRLGLYREMFDAQTLARRPFYNVGAGTFFHPYWTALDLPSEWYAKVQQRSLPFDLMKMEPLPAEDGTAKIIYTSHTIEHVKEPAVANLFREAHRALEPGGILRVTTGPDAITDYRALVNGDASWFFWDEESQWGDPANYAHIYSAPPSSVSLAERWLQHVASPLAPIDKSPSDRKFSEAEIWEVLNSRPLTEALDYFCGLCKFDPQRPGNHIAWWTHDKVMGFMREAGFSEVYRSGFNQSVSPLMRHSPLFDSTFPQMSLYVEARKT